MLTTNASLLGSCALPLRYQKRIELRIRDTLYLIDIIYVTMASALVMVLWQKYAYGFVWLSVFLSNWAFTSPEGWTGLWPLSTVSFLLGIIVFAGSVLLVVNLILPSQTDYACHTCQLLHTYQPLHAYQPYHTCQLH
ncbi:hypothetical protein B0T13DRAFT_445069 [Neurospora crassa]|nr:hypothetical protein B0T13DRAFT_445069 [Neurospora crassa]